MKKLLMVCVVGLSMFAVSCGDKAGPTAPAKTVVWGSLASCNGNPPGQQPSGNPAHAPGNSSSLDKDCKN